jgi:hypothetical protein
MMQNVKPGDTLLIKNGTDVIVTKIVQLPYGLFPYMVYDASCSLPVDCYQENGLAESHPSNSVINVTRTCEPIGRADSDWRHDLGVDPQYCRVAEDELTKALRFNEGKTPYGNLPLDLLDGAARVMAYGAKKYGDSENFRKGYDDLVSPLHSLIRHTVELQRAIQTQDKDGTGGHLLDKESGEGHLHHILTSAIILLHSMRLKGYKL